MVRRDGELVPVESEPVLSAMALENILDGLLGASLVERLDGQKELDFAFDYNSGDRFRGNVFRQRGSLACALRLIPSAIPSFGELGMPLAVTDLVRLPHGLVLVTGPTGSGKSTTLASIIDWINTHRRCHILTIEDPIEYMHSHKRSIVNQREIGPDATDFHSALRSALRDR